MPTGNTTSEYQASGAPHPKGGWWGSAMKQWQQNWSRADQLVLAALLTVTGIRCLALIFSPLGLGVDEAQYWLWGTGFDFGYYTKPPLTSWIIGISHAVFGHHEWAVRLPAPWLHFATALVLWRAAIWMDSGPNGQRAGRWAACLWLTFPAVGLGSFVISTDTPLLLFWSLGLMAMIGVITGRLGTMQGMAIAGAMIGIGMLSKYAAIYALAGLLLFFVLDRTWHRNFRLTWASLLVFLIGLLILASPNLLWNLANDFKTVRHLGDNANLDKQSYSLANSFAFLGAQFATAGPIAFALMLGIVKLQRAAPVKSLLLCMAAPPILVIMVQAFLSEANANWAIVALPALTLWLASWLADDPVGRKTGKHPGRHRRMAGIAVFGVNAGLAAALILVTGLGTFGPASPSSDPLRRLRGWDMLASDATAALARHDASAIIADRRATAALMSWHFFDQDIAVLIHDADGIPSNHFEQSLAWRPVPGRRLIALDGRDEPPGLAGVIWQNSPGMSPGMSDVTISDSRKRTLYIHYGVERD